MTDAAAGVAVRGIDELAHGVRAVADDVGGHALGHRDHRAADHQDAVVAARHHALDDDRAASALLQRPAERSAHRPHRGEIEAHTPAVVAVERLHHDREPDARGGRDRVIGAADDLAGRHRQPRRGEQLAGELLVACDVDRERRGERGHRGPDALLVPALAELHETLVVQPDEGHVAARGLVEDRLGRGPERTALGEQDQALELLLEVEPLLRLHEVVDEAHPEPAGRQADLFLPVAVGHVVLAGGAGAARLPAVDLGARLALQFDRDVLGDVTGPRALLEPFAEPAGMAPGAGVLADAGQQLQQGLVEARDRVRGPALERTEVDHEPDGRVVGEVVRSPEDLRLHDAQVGCGRRCTGGRLPLLRPRFRAILGGRHSEASTAVIRRPPRPSSEASTAVTRRPRARRWQTPPRGSGRGLAGRTSTPTGSSAAARPRPSSGAARAVDTRRSPCGSRRPR